MLDRPGQAVGAAEVVDREIDRAFDVERGEEPVDEGGHGRQAEVEAGGDLGAGEAREVGGEAAVARREDAQHAVPQVGGVGVAVEQEDRRPGAPLADEDPRAVDGDSGLAVHGVIVPPDLSCGPPISRAGSKRLSLLTRVPWPAVILPALRTHPPRASRRGHHG